MFDFILMLTIGSGRQIAFLVGKSAYDVNKMAFGRDGIVKIPPFGDGEIEAPYPESNEWNSLKPKVY